MYPSVTPIIFLLSDCHKCTFTEYVEPLVELLELLAKENYTDVGVTQKIMLWVNFWEAGNILISLSASSSRCHGTLTCRCYTVGPIQTGFQVLFQIKRGYICPWYFTSYIIYGDILNKLGQYIRNPIFSISIIPTSSLPISSIRSRQYGFHNRELGRTQTHIKYQSTLKT